MDFPPGRRREHLCKRNPVNVLFLHKVSIAGVGNNLLKDSPGECGPYLLHNATQNQNHYICTALAQNNNAALTENNADLFFTAIIPYGKKPTGMVLSKKG